MRADEIHPGDVIAGKYRVRTILSRTPTFIVDAFHVEFDQRVVIKLLLAGTGDEKEIERFRREARTLSKLESEHAARIIDVGTESDGAFYLVRQHVEGEELSTYIQQYGPRPLPEATLLILQIAEAVAEAHSHNIVLREISPSAIAVTRRPGGSPLAKIIDFGTAKLMKDAAAPTGASSLTATALFGLSPYSSPELVRKAKSVDGRADVWSLGAVLYSLLSGRPPFEGDMARLMLAITREDPPLLAGRDPSGAGVLPSEIDQIIGWALAKDLDGRFKNVYAFAHALKPYAPHEGLVLIDRIGQITNQKKGAAKTMASARPAPPPPIASASGYQSSSLPASSLSAEELREFEDISGGEDEATVSIGGANLSALAPKAGRPRNNISIPPPPPSMPPSPWMPGAERSYEVPGAPGSSPGQVPQFQSIPPYSARLLAEAGLNPETSPHHQGGVSPRGQSIHLPNQAYPDLNSPGGRFDTTPPPRMGGAPQSGALSGQALSQAPRRKGPDPRILWGAGATMAVMLPVILLLLMRESPKTSTASSSSPAATPASTGPVADSPGTQAPAQPTPPTVPAKTADPTPSAAPVASSSSSAAPAVPVRPGQIPPRPPVDRPKDPTPPAQPDPPAPSAGSGTLLAIASGGSCNFSVDGGGRGSGSSLHVTLPAGKHNVTCASSTGAPVSRGVTIKSGETSMLTFKL